MWRSALRRHRICTRRNVFFLKINNHTAYAVPLEERPMTKGFIKYKSDYKYQLADDYQMTISIQPAADIDIKFIALTTK